MFPLPSSLALPTATGRSPATAVPPRLVRPVPGLAVSMAIALTIMLAGCATPSAPISKAVYDFGPPKPVVMAATNAPNAPNDPLVLHDVAGHAALSSTAVQYRLNYANAQELRPYSLARWSMSPTQLVHQSLRAALSHLGPVLAADDGIGAVSLKVELEEFSQQFDLPESSQGVVILRATLFKKGALQAQERFEARAPATSADAAGGVQALSAAANIAADKLVQWVKTNTP